MVPEKVGIEYIGSFWGAVGYLTTEGKEVFCQMPSKQNLSQLEERQIPCDELVIIGHESWEKDNNVKTLKKWARKKDIPVRVLHPGTWTDIIA